MRITAGGRITIPEALRDRFGLNHGVEVEIIPIEQGLLVRKKAAVEHPVDRISGILHGGFDVDDYIEEVRGR